MKDWRLEADTTRLGRLLARAGGYSVHSTTGRRLGHLIWLTYELESAFPAGLRVQPPGRRGLALATSWEIPLNRVVAVLPERREVTVADREGADPFPAPRDVKRNDP